MRTGSIRVRITLIAAILGLLVLSVASVVVVTVQRGQLIDNLDSSLIARADQLGVQLSGEAVTVVPNTNAEDRFVQLLAPDGSVISATENVAGLQLFDRGPRGDHFETHSGLALEDDSFRVLARGREDGTTLVVGENIDDQNDAIRGLIATFAVIVPIASMVLAAITWGLVGRTLRPVEDIRVETRSRSSTGASKPSGFQRRTTRRTNTCSTADDGTPNGPHAVENGLSRRKIATCSATTTTSTAEAQDSVRFERLAVQ